jgi:ATP-dependent RNA helicase DeaD
MEEVESGTVVPTSPAPLAEPVEADPQTFEEMQLRPEVMQAVTEMGFLDPMPVQKAVWRPLMAGRDVMVQSRTGSGKTAAFGIPMAQGLVQAQGGVQALVLAPTRELALQVAKECGKIAQYVNLTVVPVYGGAPMGKQVDALKAGAQVVAGTPGRVLDHLRRGTLKLDGLKLLVLDECDEMLSMGFLEEITDIIKRCPQNRQTLLFSATIPEDIERIGSRYMQKPEKIALSADFVGVHEIDHIYYLVSGMGRTRDLVRVLETEKPESAIIFCNTREDTALVADFLRKHGYDAECISSDLTQKDRERVMGRMKEKNLKFLVATDIAARGIDISDLGHVINYTFPESAEVYVHRTGRTGRAGKSGVAISLVSPRELGNFYMLKLTYKIRPLERHLPSEAETRAARENARIEELKQKLGDAEPSLDWRLLAKRILSGSDAERLMALLVEDKLRAPRPHVDRFRHTEAVTIGFPPAEQAAGGEPRRSSRQRMSASRGATTNVVLAADAGGTMSAARAGHATKTGARVVPRPVRRVVPSRPSRSRR